MSYQLIHADLANALYLALTDDAFYQTLEASISGDQENKKSAMLAYMDYSIIESQNFGECFIPKKQHYGVSVWSKPIDSVLEAEKFEKKKAFIITHMGEKTYQVYDDIFHKMSNNAQPFQLAEDWYLSIIGIVPEFQGQGLGPGLIQRVLEKTDKLKVATFLETFTPRNMTFYYRLGYETLGEFNIPHTDSAYWLMRRLPA